MSSNEDDIVFDPCLGAGTSFFASLNLNRKFIGCEIERNFATLLLSTIEEKK